MTETGQINSSYSGLTTHRRCPQQWFYRYDLRLEKAKDVISPERDFGSWWSVIRAAEALERGRKLESLKQTPSELELPNKMKVSMKEVTVADVFRALEHWWKKQENVADADGKFTAELWEEKHGGEAPDVLQDLLERHLTRWADEIKHEHPLGVEVFWKKQLPKPKNDVWQDEYPDMTLVGYVDEIFWHAQRKIVVARDHKSSKQLDAATSVDDMMDSQLHLYAWGANSTVREWTNGKSIQAVAYDRARSVRPKPPMLTKSGKLRVVGGQPSIGMTDLATYLAWVESKPEFEGLKKDGSGAGIYEAEDKVIERLKSQTERDRWFQRTLSPLNRNLIQAHLRSAVDSAADAYRTQQRAEATREAQRNLSKACSWCDYAELCRSQMIGGAKGTYTLEEFGLRAKDGGNVLENGHVISSDTMEEV